ncbi:MAG TPA: DUF167 domain-containing protein [Desulfobacteria bacterium]|nr:DUF167 domain-containing protein [Desulfobacteria bacterium]
MDIQEHTDGVVLKIKVQPRASRNKIAGQIGDALKVMLTAPPVDGEANAACIDFFSDLLGVPKRDIEILTGHTGRNKLVKIYGLTKSKLTEQFPLLFP